MFWQNCSKFLVDATPDKSTEYPCVKNIKENMINNDCEFAFKIDKKKILTKAQEIFNQEMLHKRPIFAAKYLKLTLIFARIF